MHQDCALGYTGGAARVLEECDIFMADFDRLERHAGRLGHRLLEMNRAGQRECRHHLFHTAHDEVDDCAFDAAQQVAHAADHDMLDLGLGNDLFQRVGEILEDDDRFATGVVQLMLQLTRSVQRVHIHHRVTGAQNGGHGDWILQHVRHHDGNARIPFQPFALQPCTQTLGHFIHICISQVFIHTHVGVARSVLAKRFLHQVH